MQIASSVKLYVKIISQIREDRIDEVVGQEHRRTEGIYNGILTLILSMSLPFSTTIFAITHIITGFDPKADVQTPLAQWGILVDLALIPMILSAIAALFFWKLWSLTEQERLDLRAKMRELKL